MTGETIWEHISVDTLAGDFICFMFVDALTFILFFTCTTPTDPIRYPPRIDPDQCKKPSKRAALWIAVLSFS